MKLITDGARIVGTATDDFAGGIPAPEGFDVGKMVAYVVVDGVASIPMPTIEQAKAEKWQAIKTERDRRIQSCGYKVGANWYHSDTFSRTQQMGLVMLGANIPANTPWKTMGGAFVIMTQALAGQIFGAAAISDIAIFTKAEQHRTAMEASADPGSYNHLSGWPLGFGE